ncbi:MAG: hypothetical protein IPK68_10030 [Bdellovibrionales bacterium]|nr:hypothetical protein [Bdellovibrionales bacterium]
MAIKVKVGAAHKVVPDGEYKCIVREIKAGTFVGKRKTFEFHFEIAEGEHKGVQVRGFVNGNYESFSSNTKLYRWHCIANGESELPVGDEINLDDFLDKVFVARIVTKESKKTKNLFSNVEEVIRKHLDL